MSKLLTVEGLIDFLVVLIDYLFTHGSWKSQGILSLEITAISCELVSNQFPQLGCDSE